MKKYFYNLILILTLSFCFSGCGRKQKDIFSFPEKKENNIKINKLELPGVKISELKKDFNSIVLTWAKCDLEKSNILNDKQISFLGYNVYRFSDYLFIPKKPINKKVITQNFYLDQIKQKNNQTYFYLIRTVFKINKKIIEGPSSQIKELVK